MMNMRSVVAGVSVLLSVSATAETIAWFHFDEESPGVLPEADAQIVDSVGGGVGAPRSVGAGTGGNQLVPEELDRTMFPRYALSKGMDGAPRAVYDPLTHLTNVNRSAMQFVKIGGDVSTASGGVVRVSDGATYLRPTKALTIEFFFKFDGVKYSGVRSNHDPLISKRNGSSITSEPWMLGIGDDGKFKIRKNETLVSAPASAPVITGETWHHVAAVFREGSGDVEVYLDYEPYGTYATGKTGDFNYPSGTYQALYIGGSPTSGRKFAGLIDEVRLSDTALEPEDFLRFLPEEAYEEDVAVYVPFTGMGSARATENLNAVANGIQARMGSYVTSTGLTYVVDVPGDLQWGISQPGRDNVSSALFSHGEQGRGGSLVEMSDPSDISIAAGSFTAECFFKFLTDPKTGDGQHNQVLFRLGSGTQVSQVGIRSLDGRVLAVYTKSGMSEATYATVGEAPSIGAWHHVATVYDSVAHLYQVYLDYRLVYSESPFSLNTEVNGTEWIVGGYAKDASNVNFFNGLVDGFRLTRNALTPTQFLVPAFSSGSTTGTNTLVYAGMNGTTAVESRLPRMPTGVQPEVVVAKRIAEGKIPTLDGSPCAKYVAVDGVAEMQYVTNVASARIDGGIVGMTNLANLPDCDFTLEFFAKFEQNEALVRLFSIVNSDQDWQSTDNYGFVSYMDSTGAELYGRMKGADGDLSLGVGKGFCDGKWHHIAYTFTPTVTPEGKASTSVQVFVDYTPRGQPVVFASRIGASTAGRSLAFLNATGTQHEKALIDEVRLSTGVLNETQFLRKHRIPEGLMLIFR